MPPPRVTIDGLPEQTVLEAGNHVIVQDSGTTKKMLIDRILEATPTPLQAHIDAVSDAHDASAVSAMPSGVGVDGPNVQAQLGQLAALVPTAQEVQIGPTAPTDAAIELWYDDDDAAGGVTGINFASDDETIAGTIIDKALSPANLAYERPYFDVRSYGAVGDGVADDTSAIQAAIDACEADSGGIVMIPQGNYLINTALAEITAPILLRGAGSGLVGNAVTTLTFAAGIPGLVLGTAAGGSAIESLRLKSLSTVAGTDDGILPRVGRCRFQDLVIEGFGRYGVNLDTLNGNVNLSLLDKVRVVSCKSHGFYMQGNDCNSVKLIGCSAVTNAGYGFYQNNTATNCMINPHSDSNTAGAYFDEGSGNHYYDLYAEAGQPFVIGATGGYGVMLCGLNAAPAITSVANAHTSWTILTGGAWMHGLRMKPMPALSNQTSYGFQCGSPNNGHIQFYNTTTGSRIWSVHPTTHALTVWNELEVDGALNHDGTTAGFFNATPVAKPTVSGAKGGNAALASLLTALASLGLITDSSTA